MGLDGQDIPTLNVGESPLMLSQIAADISIDKPAGGPNVDNPVEACWRPNIVDLASGLSA